jgi:GntR family transcriptional regulator
MNMLRSARANSRTLTEAAHQELRQAIVNGTYSPGSQLPTEAELSELLGVSRTVVREALRVLEEDGLIDRRHGVGTFVREDSILKNLNFNFGITEMIVAAGMVPGTSYFAVRHETADGEVAAQLNLASGSAILIIERVRTANERPVVYSLDMLPEALLGATDFNLNRLTEESLYQLLQTQLGYVIDYGIAWIKPMVATPAIAEKLDLPNDALLLCITQTDYSSAKQPLIYSREYHLPDAFDFMIWRRGPAHLRGAPPALGAIPEGRPDGTPGRL